jgi:Flp pilus assembly protein TadD
VKAEPENVAYRDSLGWVLYRLGRFPEAVAELDRAVQGDQPDGVVLDHLGDACHKAGQRERAVAAWQRAAKAFEKEADEKRRTATREKIRNANLTPTR